MKLRRNGHAEGAVLETVTVHRQQVASQLVLPARITANPTAMVHIYPLISGRVLSLNILPGQEVHQGQKIGTLQSSDAAQARSDFEKAKIEADRADLQLNRAKELLQHDVMAQRDYDDLKALDDSDHSELERARQALHLLGFSENDTSDVVPIFAPISGVSSTSGPAPANCSARSTTPPPSRPSPTSTPSGWSATSTRAIRLGSHRPAD
jgi:membrane fusion protein, heavy metal efflux system